METVVGISLGLIALSGVIVLPFFTVVKVGNRVVNRALNMYGWVMAASVVALVIWMLTVPPTF